MMILIEILILSYFLYVVSYTTFFSLAAWFYKQPEIRIPHGRLELPRFCILIPAYKEDTVIVASATDALRQSYPSDNYEVVVIADRLKAQTIIQLKELPIQVIEVSFRNSTKVKALNYGFQNLIGSYDYAVILDADNLMAPDFLQRISELFATTKYEAVQGQRKAKNAQTTLAYLDGISEAINNQIYRQGTVAAGLSSSINGSGIAVNYATIKTIMKGMDSVGGFDRELELLLISQGIKVNYAKEAVVYDEKVSNSGAFQNQRIRWIASQYFYLKKYFLSGMASLLKGNITYFNSAILRNIQLPRLLNIGLLTVLTIGLFFLRDELYLSYNWWLALFLLHGLAIFAAIPGGYYSMRLIRAILSLPVLFFRMFSMLFKMKGANKKFIHTPHGV